VKHVEEQRPAPAVISRAAFQLLSNAAAEAGYHMWIFSSGSTEERAFSIRFSRPALETTPDSGTRLWTTRVLSPARHRSDVFCTRIGEGRRHRDGRFRRRMARRTHCEGRSLINHRIEVEFAVNQRQAAELFEDP